MLELSLTKNRPAMIFWCLARGFGAFRLDLKARSQSLS